MKKSMYLNVPKEEETSNTIVFCVKARNVLVELLMNDETIELRQIDGELCWIEAPLEVDYRFSGNKEVVRYHGIVNLNYSKEDGHVAKTTFPFTKTMICGVNTVPDFKFKITWDEIHEKEGLMTSLPEQGTKYKHLKHVTEDIKISSFNPESELDMTRFNLNNMYHVGTHDKVIYEALKKKLLLDKIERWINENCNEYRFLEINYINDGFKAIQRHGEYQAVNAIFVDTEQNAQKLIEAFGDEIKRYLV